MESTVLYVDDERANLDLFSRRLGREFKVITAASPDEALGLLEAQEVGVCLSDQRMPGMTGIELLQRVAEGWPAVTRMLVTAYSDRELLLSAIQLGRVHDYVLKPWDGPDLSLRVQKGLDLYRRQKGLELECESLRREVAERSGFAELVGLDLGLRPLAQLLDRVARTDSTVMVRGESGTGKELVARELHARSGRSQGPFVRTNCAALAEGLLESELFGHEAGAFTGATKGRMGRFEQAHGGTLFLDEIGDVSAGLQVRLLRVLQEREFERVGGTRTIRVNIRLIAATHRNLEQLVKDGRFREDLYHRLNVVPLQIPPLRARTSDIAPLARHFLLGFSREMGKRLDLTPAAVDLMTRYDWPGNVRELRNVIERAVVLADPVQDLDSDDLLFDFAGTAAQVTPAAPPSAAAAAAGTAPATSAPPAPGSILDEIAAEDEAQLRDALRRAGGNKARAARLLGLPRTTLNHRLRRLGIL